MINGSARIEESNALESAVVVAAQSGAVHSQLLNLHGCANRADDRIDTNSAVDKRG